MASSPRSGGPTDVASAPTAHLDTVLASDAPADAGAGVLARGDAVGRYTILAPLGAGGMGVVYAAYDPQLDRKVAIKLLHRRGRAGGTARLLREAQAMAKLSHPNVLAVLDVGTRGDQVFVAMEYVAGTTLTAWLVAPRTWREVLDVFVAAGRGLAAAHQAGLLHRDVKPDNVLVGDDGRVRVADFGLARAAGDSSASGVATPAEATAPTAPPASNALSADLTQTGALLGTPAYMAPEQFKGEGGAAADQFSFCVALYEGLYGARPFDGDTIEELLAAIVDGRIREAPEATQVPPWLRRVVVRGLAADPGARWPSIDALLAALADDPTRRRRRARVAAAAVIAVGGAAAAVVLARGGAPASSCARAGDAIDGVWGAPRKAAVRAAFDRSGAPFAPGAWAAVERTLDGYARAWSSMRIDACVAGERGDHDAAARDRCLDRRLAALRGLVGVLADADRGVVEHAPTSAYRLPPIASCADARVLASGDLDDERARATAAPLWAALDDAVPRAHAGRLAEARRVVADVAARAHAAGLPRVEGEAQVQLGQIVEELGDPASAEAAYFAGARAAIAGGDDVRLATAWTDLAYIVGYIQRRFAEGHRYADLAAATIERLGGDPQLRADLDSTLGTLEWAEGDYAPARRDTTAALAARERLLGPDHLDVATSLANLAILEKIEGRYDLAEQHLGRAIDIRQRALGADHPSLAASYSNLGNLFGAQGDGTAALAWHRRAVAVAEKSLGADSPDLAFYLTNLGASLANVGQEDEALATYRRALAIQERAPGDHADAALTLANIALIDEAHGRYAAARAGLDRALAIAEPALGKEHPTVAGYLVELGDLLLSTHEDAEALARFQRAQAIVEKAAGADNPQVAWSLVGEGDALIGLGRAAEAIAPLERAIALRERGGDPLDLADARFALGRALTAAGRDPARAASLVDQARAAYANAGAGAGARKAELDAWLRAHGR